MNNTAKCWLPQPKICLLAVVQVHCWHSRNPGDIQHPLTSLGVKNWRLTNYNSNKTCQRTIQITNSNIKNWNKVNYNSRKVSLSVSLWGATKVTRDQKSLPVTSTLTLKYGIPTVALLLLVVVFYKIIIIILIIIKITIIYHVMRKAPNVW